MGRILQRRTARPKYPVFTDFTDIASYHELVSYLNRAEKAFDRIERKYPDIWDSINRSKYGDAGIVDPRWSMWSATAGDLIHPSPWTDWSNTSRVSKITRTALHQMVLERERIRWEDNLHTAYCVLCGNRGPISIFVCAKHPKRASLATCRDHQHKLLCMTCAITRRKKDG